MNPYQIAKENNIIVIAEDLGKIYGYYKQTEGQKFIHINETLPTYYQRHITAHLLYPALYRPEEMYFVKEKLSNRFTETELEATRYAYRLLFNRDKFNSLGSFSALMRSEGLTEDDIKDLSNRLGRIWGNDRKDIEAQIIYVLSQIGV